MLLEWMASPEAWAALATLIALEIVLGIDNIIFISILVGRLPPEQRDRARNIGLALAMVARLGLLFSLVWIMGLVNPLFSIFGQGVSGRDLILIGGGLFLIAKSTHEIHNSLELVPEQVSGVAQVGFYYVLAQIAVLDIEQLSIMVIAIVIAVAVMLLAAGPISRFVDNHPTIKMLSLSFLLLIGFTLVAEGFEVHVPKGYIYFAMAFSVSVELLNLRMRRKREPITLHKRIDAE